MKIWKNLFGNGSKIHGDEVVVGDETNYRTINELNEDRVTSIKLQQYTDRALSSGFLGKLEWFYEYYKNNIIHSTSVNPSRIQIVKKGIYQGFSSVTFSTNNIGYRQVGILVNGSASGMSIYRTNLAPANGIGTTCVNSFEIELNAGDYIEITAIHNAGVVLDISTYSTLYIRKVE